jgi:chloramphenicol-sensitive protein RarD
MEQVMKKGVWYAAAAYIIWGLFPIYWKGLHLVPAVQLLGHRITWSFVFLFLVVAITRRWRTFRAAAVKPRVLLIYFVAAILISINWFTYLLAVNSGFVVESSLGYFINPLISVLLGIIVLRERLRPVQWVPIGLAATGVIYVSLAYGSVPWFAITLALSFGLYGLVKKTAPLGSLYGMALETGLMFLPALLYLGYTEVTHQGAFLHTNLTTTALLIGGGFVTTMPLLLFGSAVQRIPLALVGVLQYINPILQFLLGTLVYHEPFSVAQFIGFSIVWVALVLYGVEGLMAFRGQRAAAAAAPAN